MAKEKRYFQWVDGEDAGNVEVLTDIRYEKGEYFFEFQSGESMNMRFIAQETNDPKMLEGKAMVEIRDPHDKWRIKENRSRFETVMTPDRGEVRVEIPSYDTYTMAEQSGDGILTSRAGNNKQYIAPRFMGPFRQLPNPAEFHTSENSEATEADKANIKSVEYTAPAKVERECLAEPRSASVSVKNIEPVPAEQPVLKQRTSALSSTDPVYILVNSSAKEEKAIDLTLRLNLPSKELYKLVSAQFDNGAEKFMKCITDIISESLQGEDIIKNLTDSIKAAYMTE